MRPGRRNRKSHRGQLLSYKGNKCAHCGLSVPEMIKRFDTFERLFEFNHVDPARKHPKYDALIRRTISSEQLDELDKCVLLCRNCHGLVHAQSIAGRLRLTAGVDGKAASQTLRFQAIWDRVEERLCILTADPIKVTPYDVHVGKEAPVLYFGTELYDEGVFAGLLRRLHEVNSVLLTSRSNPGAWWRVRHVDDQSYELNFTTCFRLFQAELCATGPHDPVLWIRNGLALTNEGEVLSEHEVTCTLLYPPRTSGPPLIGQRLRECSADIGLDRDS